MKNQLLLFLLILVLNTGCNSFFEPEPENSAEAVFDNLWTVFKENYGPFEERNIDWDALYAQYRPQVKATTTEASLYATVISMLAHLDDGHVQLTTPNREIFNANQILNEKIDDGLFDLDVIRGNYLEPGYRQLDDHGYVYGKIKSRNVGYIYFDYVSDNFFILDEFLDANLSSDGIIIDLRHNQGGDFTYCFSEIGRLTDQRREVFRSRTKDGPGPSDYTPWTSWSIEPSGTYFAKPIVVLTDRYTISAGERSVMALMSLPNVTVMGDTTCGAHSTMIGRELANGWYYTIATQNTLLPDGRSYEGVGLTPDVFSKNTAEKMSNGRDQTLENAINRL